LAEAPTSLAPPTGPVAPAFPEPAPASPALPGATTSAAAAPVAKAEPATREETIFAEDWWSHARPALEFHGAFRTRAEFFHKFSLGRVDTPSGSIWPQPADHYFEAGDSNQYGPILCTGSETDRSSSSDPKNLYACNNNTQAGANLRLRLDPEIHISDNLRVRTQVDLLDNLVLGSTPEGYRFGVNDADGVEVLPRNGYNQLGVYDTTQLPPSASGNSFTDSVHVKRAWGEYTTPLGELRFGRMPDHFGLGMLYNSGDGYDDDYQTTTDRLLVTTGLKGLDLFFAASWDFVNEGALGAINIPGSQPYDRAQLDDVDQYTLRIVRQQPIRLEKLSLSRGNVVLNGGLYMVYRKQTLANDQALPSDLGGVAPNSDPDRLSDSYARRDAEMFVPDLWVQLKYKKFRFETEAAAVLGSIGSASIAANTQETFRQTSKLDLAQFGVATEIEQKLVEDRLRLKFNFAWASGDADAFDDSTPGNLIPGPNEAQLNDNTISTFRFHPAYRVDLILNRNLLQRIQGTYFFRPSVEYDFIRDVSGQRAGGGVQAIWTRATEFVQTPGHDADLGIELNGSLYFQAKDGVINDTPDTMGGFYSALQYGVLFPLAGMGYQEAEADVLPGDNSPRAAQVLRLFLGAIF
jgi:uncharacterized protein (TIGR04551 family)